MLSSALKDYSGGDWGSYEVLGMESRSLCTKQSPITLATVLTIPQSLKTNLRTLVKRNLILFSIYLLFVWLKW